MNRRLQISIPPKLDVLLRKAAQRSGMSKGDWIRRALEESLRRSEKSRERADSLSRPTSLKAPTSKIGRMLLEIEAGRS